MKISQITKQRDKGRYSIFIDGQFALGVDESVLVAFQLHKGLALTPDQLEAIKEAEGKAKLYHQALNYLSYGLKTEDQVRKYLEKSKYLDAKNPQGQIDRVIRQLKGQALLDDAHYAQAYMRTESRLRGAGPRKIQQKLGQKGLDRGLVDQALTGYSHEDQLDNARKLAEKFWRKKSQDGHALRLQKLQAHLAAQGFSRDLVQEALEGLDLAKDPEQEAHRLSYQGLKAYGKYQGRYSGRDLAQKVMEALVRRGFQRDQAWAWYQSLQKEDALE